jgi:hypothetical protein
MPSFKTVFFLVAAAPRSLGRGLAVRSARERWRKTLGDQGLPGWFTAVWLSVQYIST